MSERKEFEIVRHSAIGALEIFLVSLTARNPHGHGDWELGLVLEGGLTLFTETDRHELRAGDIYLVNRYQIHSFSGAWPGARLLVFQVQADFYRKFDCRLDSLRFPAGAVTDGVLRECLRELMLECAGHYFSTGSHRALACSARMLDILYLLSTGLPASVASEKDSAAAMASTLRLTRITDTIAERHTERLSLEDIARAEHITVCHASHFIKKMLGVSFREYLTHVRFEHALQLLNSSGLRILDVCIGAGFSSSRYLNQACEKELGCSVKEYVRARKKPAAVRPPLPAETAQYVYSWDESVRVLSELAESMPDR